MYLLVFNERGLRFGLDAAQIVEMLRLQDVEQRRQGSGGVCSVVRVGTEIPVADMAAVLGLERSGQEERAKLVLCNAEGSLVGFVIGEPEDIVQVDAEDIELLPPLIRPMVKGRGIWGVAVRKGELVILIDLAEAAACMVA
jgi:chemotaxis signal transduction protein